MQKLLPWIILVVLLTGCSKKQKSADSSGTFEATEIELSSIEGGKIVSLSFDEGDYVNKDQTLAVLDTSRLDIQRSTLTVSLNGIAAQRRQLNNKLELTEIQLQAAQREFDRIKPLYDEHTATKAQFDAQSTNLDLAKNSKQGARAALEDLSFQEANLKEQIRLVNQRIADCIIKSPVNGQVLKKYFQQGETTSPSQKLLSVADLSKMKLTVYISDLHLGEIKLNDKVKIKIDTYPDKEFSGSISWISPKAEFTPKNVQTKEARAELVYATRILADNPEYTFKIGMPADVFWK